MDFLADQTIPEASVEQIRALGNRVWTDDAAQTGGPGRLLERAADEQWVFLTADIDYRERIYEEGMARPPALVCFHLEWETPREPADLLSALLSEDELRLLGRFTLLERERMRQREL